MTSMARGCVAQKLPCIRHKATRDVADLLDALESAGLTLNLAKSAAMFKATGPKLKSFCKTHVMRRADGVYLKCATRAGKTYHVPLVKKWDYLGAILSYAAVESDTVLRRIRAADHAFTKLRQVLGSRRSLSLAQRLSVYDACVQSTLFYGILAVGVTPADAKQIHYMTMCHLRFIAHSSRHITRESNVELCTRLGRPLPIGTLHQVWERKCKAWHCRRDQLHLRPSCAQSRHTLTYSPP